MKKINTVFITSSYRSGGALFTKMLNVNDSIKVSSGTINFLDIILKNILNQKKKKL